jgi:outer membrane immunogenic protein
LGGGAKQRSLIQIQIDQGGSLMRRQLFLASVGAIALTGSSFAADLPSLAPPPAYLPPVPVFSWTGLYVGGQIGYAWDHDAANGFVPALGLFVPASINPNGVIGGMHIGYNLQINQWVAGLEGTVDGTSLKGTTNLFTPLGTVTAKSREDVQGSIRARAGIAWDRFLVYATGGAAFTGIDNDYTASVPPTFLYSRVTKTRSGWTVGGGLEYAVTNNWSLQAEYRYSDFGHYTDFPFAGLSVAPVAFQATSGHHLTENQVQAGFSYKFDSLAPAPVVAKY